MFENRFLNFVNQIIYIRNQAGRYALDRRFDVVTASLLFCSLSKQLGNFCLTRSQKKTPRGDIY